LYCERIGLRSVKTTRQVREKKVTADGKKVENIKQVSSTVMQLVAPLQLPKVRTRKAKNRERSLVY
jgi:hypothetical protein